MERIKCIEKDSKISKMVNKMTDWICLKCGKKWTCTGQVDPRQCPMCGCGMINDVKPPKKK
jgi:hypothetical protein